MAQLLVDTPYKGVRESDGRVFVAATRGPNTISGIARHLHISRQSAQSSASRLVELKLVNLTPHPSSKREKLVTITEEGWTASRHVVQQLQTIENELAELIGANAYAAVRQGIESLLKKSGTAPPLHRNGNSA